MNEENENASPWDALIGDLGVEVNPETLERKQPAPKDLPTAHVERSEVAPPQAVPSDWGGLASSLGLEVPPEEPPRKQETVASESREPARAEKPREERAREERRRDEKPREGKSRESKPREGRQQAERGRDDRGNDDRGRGDRQHGDKPRGDRQRSEQQSEQVKGGDDRKSERGRDRRREKAVEIQADIQFDEVLEDDDDDEMISEAAAAEHDSPEDTSQEPEKPRISGEAARSAFDALFSADAVNWGSAFVSPRTNVESSFLFTEGEEAVFAEDIPDKTEVDENSDVEEEPKKRPRRRRRGGRGRGRGRRDESADVVEGEEDSVIESDEALESQAEEADSDEGDEAKPEKRRRRRRGRGRGRRDEEGDGTAEEADDSQVRRRIAAHVGNNDESDEDEDDSDSGEEGRSGHRNLPTWNDAIGVIVDGNLAQRSKAPLKQQNQARGRSRGGRRHKKS
jgi:ribonuclease E